MFNIKMRKNTGSREASDVVSYKAEEKKVVKTTKKHDYATYENSLEATLSQKEAINEIVNNL